MALNLINLIKGQLGPALVSQAASQYGESESGISKAISGLVPAVVGGLANHADNPAVTDAVAHASSNGLLSNLVGGTSNNSVISSLLSTIFGDKVSGVINAISGYAGVNNSTSSSLLNLVTGATLGSIGKYSADNNLGTSGVANLLKEQKGVVSTLLPAGLSLATLGLGHFGHNTTNTTSTERVSTSTYEAPKVDVNRAGNTHVNVDKGEPSGSIWKWLLPLLLLLLAGWFLWRNCNKKAEPVTTNTDSTNVVKDSAVTAPAATKDTVKKQLSDIDLNGKMLKGYKGGMEDNMISFLKSGGYKNAADDAALKDKWYDFDNVTFKFGKSNEIEAGSEGQLQNIAEILKAYPDAKIKIGGYTDKVGDEAANVKLSQARADFIKSELAKLGVGAQVISAEGYGSKFATVDAKASDAERAKDRKMAVRFAK